MNELIDKTIASLKLNRFDVYCAENGEKAKELALSLIPDGSTVASGGSMTLTQIGMKDALVSSGKVSFLDRNAPDLTDEQKDEITKRSMTCDVFMSSTNAVTSDGELYNVDGYCNRVSALLYGPKSVIVIVGKNKIVPDLPSAVTRVKSVAAPKNGVRLSCDTYCSKAGHCVGIDGKMTDGCRADRRMCSGYTVMAFQRIPGRVKVIIVNEDLGY
ncbi:MAG: lactate utilization protein [Clostridia bacterium]|nr:lactate utilization protein [Clostridia bacterium]